MASASAAKLLEARLSCKRNGPTASITRASTGSDARTCSTATRGSKLYAPLGASAVAIGAYAALSRLMSCTWPAW